MDTEDTAIYGDATFVTADKNLDDVKERVEWASVVSTGRATHW